MKNKSVLLFIIFTIATVGLIACSPSEDSNHDKPDTYFGAWLGQWPSEYHIESFNELQDRNSDVIHMFINFSTQWSNIRNHADAIYDNDAILLLSWEPMGLTTQDINSGSRDPYIQLMAENMRDYRDGAEIWLRPMHEMNGNWYSWAIGDSSENTNESYIEAWIHIHQIFEDAGADNVKFVWNINHDNVGSGASYTGAWPGDEYVDYASIDGYNWGDTQSWSSWRSFATLFRNSYEAITSITDKPILIAEWGSAESGGDKAAWMTETFEVLQDEYWHSIVGFIWFNENKETDWRIQSSDEALEAYKEAINSFTRNISEE